MTDYFREACSAFFLEYVDVKNKNDYIYPGVLKTETMQYTIKLLLKEGVFESRLDMKRQAIKDFGVILPESVFERGA